MNEEIIQLGNSWMKKEDFDHYNKFFNELQDELLSRRPIPEKTKEDIYRAGLKLALMKLENGRTIVYRHTETDENFVFNPHTDNEELIPFTEPATFDRWATSFDV